MPKQSCRSKALAAATRTYKAATALFLSTRLAEEEDADLFTMDDEDNTDLITMSFLCARGQLERVETNRYLLKRSYRSMVRKNCRQQVWDWRFAIYERPPEGDPTNDKSNDYINTQHKRRTQQTNQKANGSSELGQAEQQTTARLMRFLTPRLNGNSKKQSY